MHKLLSSLLLSALLAPAALFAANFEGTVTMKMSGREAAAKGSRNGAAEMNLSLKGGLTRVEVNGQGQSMGVIMDPAKQQMTILMTQQRMYMVRSLPTAKAVANAAGKGGGDVTLEKTDATEKILGYNCVKYLVKDKNTTTELWLTEELGSFMGFGGGNPMGGRSGAAAPQGWEEALQGKSFFPMRVVSTEGGKEVGRVEVTAVDQKSLPDSLFTVPEGWQDMAAMMRGMPAGMIPGMPGKN